LVDNLVLLSETELLYTEENYVAFRDHRPAAKFHFLIIPKQHHPGIKHLKKEDIPIIRDLERISHKAKWLLPFYGQVFQSFQSYCYFTAHGGQPNRE
jgi:diadenosine tetraphosphate (Ap4A) HIT family hydrolase